MRKKPVRLSLSQRVKLYQLVEERLDSGEKFAGWPEATQFFTAAIGATVLKSHVVGLRKEGLNVSELIDRVRNEPLAVLWDHLRELERVQADLQSRVTRLEKLAVTVEERRAS